ncbi:MAG: hypothetical protein WKG01_20820 [Kofleriaceae bacterium]
MPGIVEIIALLLGLSGLGLQPNPRAPTPDQSLRYAMPDADVVVHLDAQSIIPGNYKLLSTLGNQPQIKASPELARIVSKLVTEVEAARGLAKSSTGIDLTTDIYDATMFVKILPGKDPTFVAAVRGKLTTQVIEKIGKMVQKQTIKVGGGMMIEMGGDEPAIGVTRDGVMLAGAPRLVRERLADTWKVPARPVGSNLAYAQEVLAARPVFAVALSMSATARKEANAKIGGKNFMTDVISRHKFATFSVFHDGIGWSWGDTTKAGLESMALMSEGTIDLLRAAQIAPRGVAKLLLGALDSYKGDKQVDELIRRKADVLKIMQAYSGDGSFKAAVNKDPVKLRLDVRATGKTLSEVVPAGALIPIAVLGLLTRDFREPPMPPPPGKTQPRVIPRPAPPRAQPKQAVPAR